MKTLFCFCFLNKKIKNNWKKNSVQKEKKRAKNIFLWVDHFFLPQEEKKLLKIITRNL